MVSEERFNCVLGKDYHIINNNVDNMTYYLQDGNDVVLVTNLINRLVEENEQLQKQVKSFETTMNATSDYNAFLESKITTLEKENKELNSIKKFAERNGINIFLIDEAFRKCWKDNGKLFEEKEQLRHELDSLTGCYCADNKEFKDYWRIGYDD